MLRWNKYRLSIFLSVICFSCNSENTNSQLVISYVSEQLHKIDFKEFNRALDAEFRTINLNRENIRRNKLSISAVAQGVRNLMFEVDSLTFDQVLDTLLVVRNNTGQWVSIPFRNLIHESKQ